MDNLFFIASKIVWLLINPNSLIIISLILLNLLFVLKIKQAKKWLYTYSTVFFILTFLPIGNWLLYPLEKHFSIEPTLPKKVDGIILLGGSFIPNNSQAWGKVQTNNFADRIHNFIMLIQRYPQAKAIFTGGSASVIDNTQTEAYFAQQLFNQLGVDANRITYENKARNTHENALYSKILAMPKPKETWIVVSTAFHLPRVVGVFCKQNWPVIPYPADFHSNPNTLYTPSFNLMGNLQTLDYAIHEWLGLAAYYLSNKTTDWLPEQCH